MLDFKIKEPDRAIIPSIQNKIDNLTKPKGSLGLLEELALQIAWIQQTTSPKLVNPHHIVFVSDHGIAEEKVSLSPQEITYQMLVNFVKGGAGVNFLTNQHHFNLKIVDLGVVKDVDIQSPNLIHQKIRKGTSNYLHQAAMSSDECIQALKIGAKQVKYCFNNGCNIISFGELGITNTSASAIWMHLLTKESLKECIGAGSDHTGEIVQHKYEVLSKCIQNYKGELNAFQIMSYFGGFEMVAAVGAMLQAAELGMTILIDGFIMTNCLLMAKQFYPHVTAYAIYGHQGKEVGHTIVLKALHAKPILNLGLRLGEGTGALCAYPIVESAIRMINEMSSFKNVEVTKYF